MSTTPTPLVFNAYANETLTGAAYDITQSNSSGPGFEVLLNFTAPKVTVSDTVTGLPVGATVLGGSGEDEQVDTFNQLAGSVQLSNAYVELHGQTFDPVGTTMISASDLYLDAATGGSGMLFLGPSALVVANGSVGAHDNFELKGAGSGAGSANPAMLQINDPGSFAGQITADSSDFFIQLAGLTATSYAYRGHTLTLYNGDQVVDRLHLAASTSFGVYAQNSGVSVSGYIQSNLPVNHGA